MLEVNVTKTIRPEDMRGNAGNSKVSTLQYPAELPKIYSKIDFFEYRRASDTNAERRQTASVILPVPERFLDSQNISISDREFGYTGFVASLVSRGATLGGSINELSGKFESAGKSFIQDPAQAIATMLALVPGSTDTQLLARQYAGTIPNPHVSAVFNGVDLKEFNFNFRLSPRSQQEADTINRIINVFRARTHPNPGTVAGAIYSLDYPDLAKMTIVGAKGLTSVNFSFISRFNVSYSSGSNMAFYKDGQPIEIALDFNMKEIDIRTRENYDGSSRDVSREARATSGQTNPGRES